MPMQCCLSLGAFAILATVSCADPLTAAFGRGGQTAGNLQCPASAPDRFAAASNRVGMAIERSPAPGLPTLPAPPRPPVAFLPPATSGQPYSAGLTAYGGSPPYRWNVIAGRLPGGFAVDAGGVITGTPSSPGLFPFTAEVADSSAQTAACAFLLSVGPHTPPSVTTTGLPDAVLYRDYRAGLRAAGGTPPYAWVISSGQLPPALSINRETGVISGAPAAVGSFVFTVELTDAAGASAAANLVLVVAESGPSNYRRFYSPTSFWNTPIPAEPDLDPNSAAIIQAAIAPFSRTATFANTDAWGIALAFADANSATYNVSCTRYCTGDAVWFAIPAGAQPTTGSDHHLAVVAGDLELDMWQAAYHPAANAWSAGSRVLNDLSGWGANCAPGKHCNGAVAAGFALLGGAIRPEEIRAGRIEHALSITTPYTRARYIACPATHTDGRHPDVNAIPEGARIQLDPGFDVSSQPWPSWVKVIATALQVYGAYVADTGGALAIRGVADLNLGPVTWAGSNTPKGGSLSMLPWTRFRVLLLEPCN